MYVKFIAKANDVIIKEWGGIKVLMTRDNMWGGGRGLKMVKIDEVIYGLPRDITEMQLLFSEWGGGERGGGGGGVMNQRPKQT